MASKPPSCKVVWTFGVVGVARAGEYGGLGSSRASPATITLAAAAACIAIQASEDANLVPYAGSAHDYCLTWSFGPASSAILLVG
ncbi:hypothetical protein DFH08DRAFT_975909 [Mycena albidolilacea]|uniref:Uncharacterized protein n=1 Tax=Mycena albidolilacea TaxID=1033008 RepID=A0AAD6Z472_9AGAR|nr:hypothetical protein DFH08DRAFT_975909 [Mycena albidolilacea]